MKGWRTFLFQALVAVLGVAEAFDWVPLFGDKYGGLLLLLIALVNTGLRAVTTTPLGRSE